MALEVGGYDDVPDWPRMGPSLLIATCLISQLRVAVNRRIQVAKTEIIPMSIQY